MKVHALGDCEPFTTADGSTIRELHHTDAQSLAEASLPAGGRTQRHYHRLSEEIYHVTHGEGRLEIDGEERVVRPGDAAVIPPGAWHQIEAATDLRFLCMCVPPYSHEDTYFD